MPLKRRRRKFEVRFREFWREFGYEITPSEWGEQLSCVSISFRTRPQPTMLRSTVHAINLQVTASFHRRQGAAASSKRAFRKPDSDQGRPETGERRLPLLLRYCGGAASIAAQLVLSTAV